MNLDLRVEKDVAANVPVLNCSPLCHDSTLLIDHISNMAVKSILVIIRKCNEGGMDTLLGEHRAFETVENPRSNLAH